MTDDERFTQVTVFDNFASMGALRVLGLVAIVAALCASCAAAPDGPAAESSTAGSAGSGPQCLAVGVNCTSTPNNCCSGLCINDLSDLSQPAICARTCTAASECASGCCSTVQNTTLSVCGPRGFCSDTCARPGSSCTGDTDCCVGTSGLQAACISINGGVSTCADKCTQNSGCVSACCAPVNNSQFSVCSAPQFCG